ncbi:MAG: hypothetical protein V1831_00400 [Candidatus Woesearchaeota archaeon]
MTELILKNFIEVKQKKGANKSSNKDNRKIQNSNFSISSILINSALDEVKNESKGQTLKEETLEESSEEKIIKDEKNVLVNGGYGTISKHYGISKVNKYTNYDKIWGYLGAFKAYSMHEIAEKSNEIARNNGESSREMVSTETIEKSAKHFKYFVVGEQMSLDVGFVPPFGSNIDSKEWEKYRTMCLMTIYQPLMALKRASA